jgi:hypothetical protein
MSSKRFIFFIFHFSLSLCFLSCKNEQVTPMLAKNCDTVNLTYTNSMQAIISAQCGSSNSSCHSGGRNGSGYDYTTYSGIYSNYQKGLLYSGLFGSLKNMPQTPQPGWSDSGACMLEKFKAWMNKGCPQ